MLFTVLNHAKERGQHIFNAIQMQKKKEKCNELCKVLHAHNKFDLALVTFFFFTNIIMDFSCINIHSNTLIHYG